MQWFYLRTNNVSLINRLDKLGPDDDELGCTVEIYPLSLALANTKWFDYFFKFYTGNVCASYARDAHVRTYVCVRSYSVCVRMLRAQFTFTCAMRMHCMRAPAARAYK